MNLSPIIIFVYNRAHHLDSLLNSLQKNNLFEKSKVLIFSDGPKNEIDKGKIYKVRELLKKKLIPKNSEIIENNFNLGLSRNIIEGITKTLKIYDSVIILEDDLEVSPYFLNYMNDALKCVCVYVFTHPRSTFGLGQCTTLSFSDSLSDYTWPTRSEQEKFKKLEKLDL